MPTFPLQQKISACYSAYPDRCALVALAFFALLTRFLIIHHPESAVFDEVHFNYFAGFYYTGQYYYDIHPPLGKLLIALAALPFGGIAPEDIVRTISTPYPSDTYIAMRALPALFGSALPLLLFLIARELRIGVKSAFVAGALVILDNALLIQARLILLDAMLLGFGFLSLWLFLCARRNGSIALWCASAFFAGCSFSIKWIGVSFIGLIGLIIISDWIRALWRNGWHSQPFFKGSAFLAVAILTYLCTFYIHFTLLPISHKQGDQFMTPDFRTSLEGSEYYGATGTVQNFRCPSVYRHTLRYGMPNTEVPSSQAMICDIEYRPLKTLSFFEKTTELHRTMWSTNQGLSQGHPDASPWYLWPLMHKPLYYWYGDGARIYLIGNPAVWWLCALAVIALALLAQFRFKAWREPEAFWILGVGFAANILPFMIVTRVMFMYHYLTSLCFSILLTAYLLDKLPWQKYVRSGYLFIALLGFLLVSPITYGVNWFGSDLLWFLRLFGWHP